MSRETEDRKRREKARARDRMKDRIKGAAAAASSLLPRVAGAPHDCLRLYCPSESPSVAMLRALLLPEEEAAGFLDKFLRTRRDGKRCNFLAASRLLPSNFARERDGGLSKQLVSPPSPARHSRLFLIVGLGAEEAAASSEREESPGDQRRRRAPMPAQQRRRRARPRRPPPLPKRPESSSALGGRGRSHASGSGIQAHFS